MYTIICTSYREGKIEKQVEGKKVRKECERLRKVMSSRLVTNYVRIEVQNNDTGEIREYWNNGNNTIQF